MLATGFRIGGSVHVREQRDFLYSQRIDNDMSVDIAAPNAIAAQQCAQQVPSACSTLLKNRLRKLAMLFGLKRTVW